MDPFVNVPEGDNTFKPCVKFPKDALAMKNVDFICISNEHFDHFDKKFVQALASKESAVVVGHESVLNELDLNPALKHNVKVGDKFSMRGVDVEVMSSHYPSSFYPLSYLLAKDGEKVFFAGNTALTDSFSQIKTDVALLPIGGSSTMDIIDAVRATKTMKPTYAIPMHYNSFETILADPNDFKTRIEKSILKTIPIILKPGQSFKT